MSVIERFAMPRPVKKGQKFLFSKRKEGRILWWYTFVLTMANDSINISSGQTSIFEPHPFSNAAEERVSSLQGKLKQY